MKTPEYVCTWINGMIIISSLLIIIVTILAGIAGISQIFDYLSKNKTAAEILICVAAIALVILIPYYLGNSFKNENKNRTIG